MRISAPYIDILSTWWGQCFVFILLACMTLFSRVLRDYTRLCQSVSWSVGRLVGFCGLWPHCSCQNALETLSTAPTHQHTSGVAIYPALFFRPPLCARYAFQFLVACYGTTPCFVWSVGWSVSWLVGQLVHWCASWLV